MAEKSGLDHLVAQSADECRVAGVAVAVVHGDETVFSYQGSADVDAAVPVTASTRFRIASITKPMVATVMARLAGRGMLDFDDVVGKHVPELATTDFGATATIRQLLAGTAGVAMSVARDQAFDASGDDCLSVFAADVAAAEPSFSPGTSWSYSNTAWSLLGRVIETATGRVWEDAMRTELFEPAGMDDMAFEPDGARHYTVSEGGYRELPTNQARALGPGGGTVWATASDIATFARAHFDGSIAPVELLEELRAEGAYVGIPQFMDSWCHGWARFDWPGGPVWGWDGIWSGYRAILRLLPEQRSAVVMLANTTTGRALYRQLFPSLMERFGVTMPAISLSADPIAEPGRYAGTYAWPDVRMEVVSAAGSLIVRSAEREIPIRPVSDRAFVGDINDVDGTTFGFGSFGEDGRPQMFYTLVWGLPRIAGTTP